MQGEPNRWKLRGNRGANTFSSPLSARKGVVSLFLGGNRVTRLASLVVADLDPWKIHRSGSFEGATNTTPTVHSEISVCRFTPRRRRLVTSSRPPAPRVHARQTPLNFYSILLSPSSRSSIPSPSLPRQIIYFSSTKLPRSRANTLSVLLTESSTTNYHLFLFPLSSTKLSLASTSYSRSPTSRPTLLVSPTSCNLIRQYLGAYE